MTTPIYVQDVTLRDGMHAVRHRMDPEDVRRIVLALDAAGVDAIEVAHGDGLSGGSVNYGPGSHSDWTWIEAAASVIHASCGRRSCAGGPTMRRPAAGPESVPKNET